MHRCGLNFKVLLSLYIICFTFSCFAGRKPKYKIPEMKGKDFVFATPIYLKDSSDKKTVAEIIGVEIINRLIDEKVPWKKLDFSLDTLLRNVNQNPENYYSKVIIPEELCSGGIDLIVIIYGVDGKMHEDEWDEIAKKKIDKVVQAMGGEVTNRSSMANRYDDVRCTVGLFDLKNRKIIFKKELFTKDIEIYVGYISALRDIAKEIVELFID